MLYVKIENGIVSEIISRPRWFDDSGEPVSDDYLISEGIFPLHNNFPTVHPIEQKVSENNKEDWEYLPDRVNKTYTVVDLPIALQRLRYPKKVATEFRKKLRNIEVVQRFDTEGEPYLDGIYEEDILEAIAAIADKKLAAEARDYFLYAQFFERTNPWVDILGQMFGLTPEQIDTEWLSE